MSDPWITQTSIINSNMQQMIPSRDGHVLSLVWHLHFHGHCGLSSTATSGIAVCFPPLPPPGDLPLTSSAPSFPAPPAHLEEAGKKEHCCWWVGDHPEEAREGSAQCPWNTSAGAALNQAEPQFVSIFNLQVFRKESSLTICRTLWYSLASLLSRPNQAWALKSVRSVWFGGRGIIPT